MYPSPSSGKPVCIRDWTGSPRGKTLPVYKIYTRPQKGYIYANILTFWSRVAFEPCNCWDVRPANRGLRGWPCSFPWFDTVVVGVGRTSSTPQLTRTVLLYAVPKKAAKSSGTSFAGIKPSNLACKSGL